jgi:NADH-quinone oxidoreductase subunit C
MNFSSNRFLDKCTVAGYEQKLGTVVIVSYRQLVQEVATYLKLSTCFYANVGVDCIISDKSNFEHRFTITYIMKSFVGNTTFLLVTKTNEILPIPSLCNIYPAFEWAEREAWDLMGVMFIKHPDLRRILTDYGFHGHPFRKDFPLTGFKEVRYNDTTKLVEYGDLEVSQSLRIPSFITSW